MKIEVFGLIFVLALAFASAQQVDSSVPIAPVDPVFTISLNTPSEGSHYTTNYDVINVAYNFDVFISSGSEVNCEIYANSIVAQAQVSGTHGTGILSLGPNTYDAKVICYSDDGFTATSNVNHFEVRFVPIVITTETQVAIAPVETGGEPQNPNNNNNGGGSSRKPSVEEESNGKRILLGQTPNLEELSTPVTETKDSNKSGLSAITGAVIGAIGKRGVAGIIGLVVLLAVIGAFVYNRRKLGIVKAEAK